MTFAIFKDAGMIYSPVKSNVEGFFGSEGTEGWSAVVTVERVNVSGVACRKYGSKSTGGRSWAKEMGQGVQAGVRGAAEGFSSLAGDAGTM